MYFLIAKWLAILKLNEFAEILTHFHSKFEPFYQGVVNQTDTINHDGNVANEAGPQLNSNINSGWYLDFSSNSTQPNPRPDDIKRPKKKKKGRVLPEFKRLSPPD